MARSSWGNITKVRNGVYRIRYTVPGIDGSGVQKCETIHGTQREAQARLSQIRGEVESTNYTLETVEGFWNSIFLPECKEHRAPATVDGYERMYRAHIRPEFGDMCLKDITGLQVQRWLDTLSYGGARHAKGVLSAMIGRAFALDMVPQNVMARRYLLPKEDKRVKSASVDVYSLDELTYIYKLIRGEYWEPAFMLSAFAGARREESCSPRLDEFIFEKRDGQLFATVEIVRGFQTLKSTTIEVKPKTANSRRWLVLPEPYSVRMREIVEDFQLQGFTWLLDNGEGWVISPDLMSAAYKRWFLDKDIRYIPWKNLRNSYCTIMHANGVDLNMISKLLGHTTQQTTFKHYDRPGVNEFINTVEKAQLDK